MRIKRKIKSRGLNVLQASVSTALYSSKLDSLHTFNNVIRTDHLHIAAEYYYYLQDRDKNQIGYS